MSLDLYTTQQDIFNKLVDIYGVDFVFTGEVPDRTTLIRRNNRVEDYYIVRFNDLVERATYKGRSFGSVRQSEYYSFVDVLCISGVESKARSNAHFIGGITDILTGWVPNSNTGELTKTGAGGVFTIPDENAKPMAFICPVSFRFDLNQSNVSV